MECAMTSNLEFPWLTYSETHFIVNKLNTSKRTDANCSQTLDKHLYYHLMNLLPAYQGY